MNALPFTTTDWNTVPASEARGIAGTARQRTVNFGGFRVRVVEYSPGYIADHWCATGHVLYCMEGAIISELADGRVFTISKGMSYTVSDKMSLHRSTSPNGATLLIVDGAFLRNEKIFTRWKM